MESNSIISSSNRTYWKIVRKHFTRRFRIFDIFVFFYLLLCFKMRLNFNSCVQIHDIFHIATYFNWNMCMLSRVPYIHHNSILSRHPTSHWTQSKLNFPFQHLFIYFFFLIELSLLSIIFSSDGWRFFFLPM